VHTPYRTWSAAKSIAATVFAVAVADGHLDLEKSLPIPEWKHPLDPRRRIRLENLLNMSSGLISTGSNTPLANWGGINMAQPAVAAQLKAKLGTRWKHSNYDIRASRGIPRRSGLLAHPLPATILADWNA